jgi:hypothetical protein
VFAAIALVTAYIWRSNGTVLIMALAVAAALAAVSLTAPLVLRPLNVAWMRIAHLISKVMNPIVMLILFSIVIIPSGLLMQRWRDPLHRHRKGDETTYWIARQPQDRSNMINQF